MWADHFGPEPLRPARQSFSYERFAGKRPGMTEPQAPRLALITGASGGIGEAFAHAIAADGYGLAIAARSEAELARVERAVTSTHSVPVTAFSLDLSERGA